MRHFITRDGRYAVSRSASVPFTEQQRMHPYNRMLPGRNIHQSNSSTPGGFPGANPGVRMLPGGNGVGIMCGTNRSMPVRPGYQGISPSSMLNSGSMVSSGMVPNANSVNMHSGIGSNQGNSMMRPHDTLNMMQVSHCHFLFHILLIPSSLGGLCFLLCI